MSEQAHARDRLPPPHERWEAEHLAPSIRQRRAAASAARRRRLLYLDIGLGAALALVALLIANGLALIALTLVIVCLTWSGVAILARVRRRLTRRAGGGCERASSAQPAGEST